MWVKVWRFVCISSASLLAFTQFAFAQSATSGSPTNGSLTAVPLPTKISGPICDASSTLLNIGGLCIENKVNTSILVTIILFFMGYVIAKILERRSKHNARRVYLLALLQEIKLNVDSLAHAQNLFPPAEVLYKFIRKPPVGGVSPRPFITFNFYSTIFKTKTEVLQDLEENLIGNIIELYGRLEGIAIDVAAIDKNSYDTISDEGKDAIFADLKRDVAICLVVGKNVDSGIRLYLKLA